MNEIPGGAPIRDVVRYYIDHPEQLKALVSARESGESVHHYLSTACLHENHFYCQSNTGFAGSKRAARCKFCDAPCICTCHGP